MKDIEAQARDALFMAGREPPMLDGPLAVQFRFHMPTIKSMPKWQLRDIGRGMYLWHYVKPDTSNLCKLIEDALSEVVWVDDARICRLVAEKVYGLEPRTEVSVSKLEPAKRR